MARRPRRRSALSGCAAFLLLLPSMGAAAGRGLAAAGAGMSFSQGTDRYHKFSFFGDADWNGRQVDPYAWSQLNSDSYLTKFGLGGGVWKELPKRSRIKGGLGLAFGRIRDTDQKVRSVMLETGAEKDFFRSTWGAEYQFTAGTIGSNVANASDKNVHNGARIGRAESPEAAPETHAYNEFSGYARLPVKSARLGLRLSLSLASNEPGIVAETVNLRIPLTKAVSALTALTFEQQGGDSQVYFSMGVYFRFAN